MRAYLSDAALEELKRAGFTFVRVPVQPDMLAAPDALADAVARVQRHGLAVVVALFADGWHLETSPADRAKLLATWRSLAPMLRRFDPAATFPEVLNEPVFAGDPAAWAGLQHRGRDGDPRQPARKYDCADAAPTGAAFAASCRSRRNPIPT